MQARPAVDDRDGVEPAVEAGVGEQLTIAEERERRRRSRAAGRSAPTRHRGRYVPCGERRVPGGPGLSPHRAGAPRPNRGDRRAPLRRCAARRAVGRARDLPVDATDGGRDAITRVASIRGEQLTGPPSAIAIRAPISVSAFPWTAAWARVSIDPRRGLARHRHVEPAADRPPRRRAITAPLRGDGVDVGEQDAVGGGTASGHVDRVSAGTGSSAHRHRELDATRAATSRERVASAPRRPSSRRPATSSSGSARSATAAVTRRSLQRQALATGRPIPRGPASDTSRRLPRRRPGHRSWSRCASRISAAVTSAPAISISLPSSLSMSSARRSSASASSNRPASASAWAWSACSAEGSRRADRPIARLGDARTRRSRAACRAAASPGTRGCGARRRRAAAGRVGVATLIASTRWRSADR